MADKWTKIGEEKEFIEELKTVSVGRERVVIAKLKGKFFAFTELCPHAQGPMSRAEINGAIVSCPLHAWCFDLEQGGKELHGYRDLPLKEIKIENGTVYVAI